MHRLNAWQIAAFPERQKSNKRYKKSLLCFLYTSTCKLAGERRHNEHAVVQLWVCANLGGEIKKTGVQTPVMWSLTSSTPDGGRGSEAERQSIKEGNREKKFWTNSPSHRQDWMTPLSCNTNQSQTCQLDSTCTFPACVPTQQDKPAV